MVRQLFKDLKDDLADSFENGKKELTNLNDKIQDKLDNLIDYDPNSFITLPEIHQDGCNTIIRVNSGFPGTNLQFVYRNPSCLNPPTPPPFEPDSYASCGRLFLRIAWAYIRIRYKFNPIDGSTVPVNVPVSVEGFVAAFTKCHPGYDTAGVLDIPGGTGFVYYYRIGETTVKRNVTETLAVNKGCGNINPPFGRYYLPTYFLGQGDFTVPADAPEGTVSELLSLLTTSVVKPELISLTSDSPDGSCRFPPQISPPPPPPPPPMSCCPNVQQNDQLLKLILKRIGEPKEVTIFDEDLNRKGAQKAKKKPESLNDFLKLAVERTEIISRIVGIENFPITVPDTMIEPHKEGVFAKIFGFIDGKKKRKINTIAEFIAWMSEQDSAVLGQFHQVIEFETGSKDKKGKPEKSTVVLPNIAEALKEITILTAQMAKQNNVQTEVIFKIAAEVVAARTAAHKSALIAADIQDYLDYPTQTITGTINTSVKFPYVVQNSQGKFEVTEPNEDYKEFLKPGSVSFSYDDWTGDSSLRDHLMDLLQISSMLRAILYQRTDK